MKTILFPIILLCFLSIASDSTQHKELTNSPFVNDPVTIIVAGDVSFDLKIRPERVITYHYPRSFFTKVKEKIFGRKPFPEYLLNISENDDKKNPTWYETHPISFQFSFKNKQEMVNYPFAKIDDILKTTDLVFVNLETPLAEENKCRIVGYFISDPIFTQSLSNAGVKVVSIANNHAWDGDEDGFIETLNNLQKSGIRYVGGGRNLEEARMPVIFNLQGIKIAFLAYSQQFKYNFRSVADDYNPGILPFSVRLVAQDIKRVREKCDFIFVSLHWGIENTSKIHPKAIELAHQIIDAGADAIVGHHSHIPKGIEVYNSKPIFYSLGNFIFGQNRSYWTNNIIGKLKIKNNRIIAIEIIPISGTGDKIFQPEVLTGKNANMVLRKLKELSAEFATDMVISENRGFIELP
jgi:poly-gamma-glutamate synthesis protein (capsule biosynthesis protein)